MIVHVRVRTLPSIIEASFIASAEIVGFVSYYAR